MIDLINRLEAAVCGSRELDCEVALAAGVECRVCNGGTLAECVARGYLDCPESFAVPQFTTSIDAAYSLKPDEWYVLLVATPDLTVCDLHTKPMGVVGNWPAHAEAATPALAICIAALKARAATGGS